MNSSKTIIAIAATALVALTVLPGGNADARGFRGGGAAANASGGGMQTFSSGRITGVRAPVPVGVFHTTKSRRPAGPNIADQCKHPCGGMGGKK